MDDNSQSGTATAPDDEIDFRPAQASKRSAGAPSDGIDFQPAERAPKTPPAALLSVYAAPQGGLQARQRALRVLVDLLRMCGRYSQKLRI
jgi:hypothetical protein